MWECHNWSVLYVAAMCDFTVDRTVQQMNSSCSEATDPYHLSQDESPWGFFPVVVDDMRWKIPILPSMGQRCIFTDYFIAVFCKSLGNTISGAPRQSDFKVPLQDKLGQHIWWSYFNFDSHFYYPGAYLAPFCLEELANGVKCIQCGQVAHFLVPVLYI